MQGEVVGAFLGDAQSKPDVVITHEVSRAVLIENEYLPATTLTNEAIGRLGRVLDPDKTASSSAVNAVIALRSPHRLNQCHDADEVDDLIRSGIEFEYALFTGDSPDNPGRFPRSGFIPGNLRDLAAFICYAATPEGTIEEAIRILESGIAATAYTVLNAARNNEVTRPAVERELKQEFDEQSARMAATIMINAFMFHMTLAGSHGLAEFDDLKIDGITNPAWVLDEWYRILKVNYWSIFKIARAILASIEPIAYRVHATQQMVDTAEKLNMLGVSQSHDLAGTVFQRLIADRKFLATFYTRPESATLLAHLAIPDDGHWDSRNRVKDFKVADYACGTGTLIHAAYRRLNQLHRYAGGKPSSLHAHMLRKSLTACDVLPSAVHLTASMLASSHPKELYEGTRTIVTQYGDTPGGGVSIGSLDLLASNGVVEPLIPMHSGTAVAGSGEDAAEDTVDMPPYSQDVVIMNPPFTRAGSDWEGDDRESDAVKPFRGLGNSFDTQKRMSALKRKLAQDTCSHGYAGLASYFMALADRMVSDEGTIAVVLPLTSLQGDSWQKRRDMLATSYSDVIVVTIASQRPADQSFSADTNMAETLVIARKTPK